MKKLSLCWMFCFLFLGNLAAQWSVGGKVGANFSNLKNNSKFEGMRQRVGFNLGAVGGYQFNDWFGIQGEILYTQYRVHNDSDLHDSHQLEIEGHFVYIDDATILSHYIDVPLLAEITPFKRIPGLNFEIGLQPGFLLKENVSDGEYNVDTNLYDRNPVNCSLLLGAAFKFPARWYFDLRYVLGLTDNYECYSGLNTHALQLSLGYLFQL